MSPSRVVLPLAYPLENERGERLIAVHENSAVPPASPGFAVVIAACDDRYLLVRNVWRRVWELPGGLIDPGESAAECAAREFAEESSQQPLELWWRAWLEIESGHGGASKKLVGSVFCARIAALAPFTPSDEIEAIGLWSSSALPEGTSAIDAALLALYRYPR